MRSPRVLTKRAQNRALLERRCCSGTAGSRHSGWVVERLVALQAQGPRDPYVALWSRVEPLRADPLGYAMCALPTVQVTRAGSGGSGRARRQACARAILDGSRSVRGIARGPVHRPGRAPRAC